MNNDTFAKLIGTLIGIILRTCIVFYLAATLFHDWRAGLLAIYMMPKDK